MYKKKYSHTYKIHIINLSLIQNKVIYKNYKIWIILLLLSNSIIDYEVI